MPAKSDSMGPRVQNIQTTIAVFEEGWTWCILDGRRSVFASWIKMSEVRGVNFVEGVRSWCWRNHLFWTSFFVAGAGFRMPWLHLFMAGAIFWRHQNHIKSHHLRASFLRFLLSTSNFEGISPNHFVFKLSTSKSGRSLAKSRRFRAFNFQFWRKPRRKAAFSAFVGR